MVVYRPRMVSGIRRGDEGGIEYWMEREGKGRGRVSSVMKRGISDVSSVLNQSMGENVESYQPFVGCIELGMWIRPKNG